MARKHRTAAGKLIRNAAGLLKCSCCVIDCTTITSLTVSVTGLKFVAAFCNSPYSCTTSTLNFAAVSIPLVDTTGSFCTYRGTLEVWSPSPPNSGPTYEFCGVSNNVYSGDPGIEIQIRKSTGAVEYIEILGGDGFYFGTPVPVSNPSTTDITLDTGNVCNPSYGAGTYFSETGNHAVVRIVI